MSMARADSPYSGVLARWCAAVSHAHPHPLWRRPPRRDFVSVHDVAAPTYFAGHHRRWHGANQVATGRSVTLSEVLDALDAVAPQPVQRRYNAARRRYSAFGGSSARLQAVGWRAQVPLQTGLAELIGAPDVLTTH